MRLKLDSIVTGGPAATRAAKKATSTIPIVMGITILSAPELSPAWRDPAEHHGLSSLAPEISGKQLEFLKEVFPDSPEWPSLSIRRNRALNSYAKRRNSSQRG